VPAGAQPDAAVATDDADRSAQSAEQLLDRAVAALGGSRRDGQHAMTVAVARALVTGEHLVVQAGTGTGKSLAYLVPAVRHAVTQDECVVVSTATLALQRQLLTRDLPVVTAALTPLLPRPPRVALLKGWHNYLCRNKVEGGYPLDDVGALFDLPEPAGAAEHPAPSAESAEREGLGDQVVRLREWADETDTGDRDDLVPGVSARAWRQVSVTALECIGATCPLVEECFPDRARAAAREADLVVTNHAMLGIAASGGPGVLPEHQVLVVDEAHELADRVTAQATGELSAPTVEHAARLARRLAGMPTTDLDAAGRALTAVLVELPEERFPDGLPAAVQEAVAAVRDAARALLSVLRPQPGASGPDGGRKMAASAMLALFETAERMAAGPEESRGTVRWCARSEDRRGERVSRLHAAPLAVDGLIRTHLLAGRTAVLTSATVALGGSFDPVARAVGLSRRPDAAPQGPDRLLAEEAADELAAVPPGSDPPAADLAVAVISGAVDEVRAWHGLDVGSPFDYARQGICYVARHLPPPGREPATHAQLDEIEALITAAGGRTLGLFSSRRAAEVAADAMRGRLDVPVLVQGDDQLPTLVERFAADEATCLFGTLSLWQGVDVPGPTCRLVLIDRIPFPRPDDPLAAARTQAVAGAGGNGFMAVSATHAALLLAQGSGRLIRSSEDRGVVAVLDPRLATARYASFLTRSMPPFWWTTDREVALSALRRLRGEH